jgi:enoyl-CoA hydratase
VTDSVNVDVDHGIAVVTLNRPEARNAFNSEMLERFARVMQLIEDRVDINVVILTGAGKSFCAGLDLKEMAASGANVSPRTGRPWRQPTKPMIGAINGAAVTGGLELALSCDFLIASPEARFADTHTRVGLVPFWGLSVLLPQAIGLRRARELSLTGNFMSAEEALHCGLVNRLVPAESLMAETLSIATDIASTDQRATRELLARYAEYSGGGRSALAEEVDAAVEFFGPAFDLSEIESRRVALVRRAKLQQD